MSNKQQSSLDDDLRVILDPMSITPMEDKIAQIKQAFADELEAEYRRGYNDNARDCLCDGISYAGFPERVPHKHLMDDGKSHNIRPNIAGITEAKDE